MNRQPYYITFAGPLGCSKSPVAQHLSCELSLPILANDIVRNEIKEDTLSGEPNRHELDKRVGSCIRKLISRKQSFIHDASQDRRWDYFTKSQFEGAGYGVGIISFDLSPQFYRRLVKVKGYGLDEADIVRYIADHERFLASHRDLIICHITDETFPQRLERSLTAVRQFIDDIPSEKR